jgi:hypothetical protein
LTVDWGLSEREDYSHSTRWAAYRPRIDVAYSALDSNDGQLRIAFIVAGELSKRDLQSELNEALHAIGWEMKGDSLIAVGGSVRELFFPDGSHHDAYIQIRGILQGASTSVCVVDPYVDSSTLTLLSACTKPRMRFRILTFKRPTDFELEAVKWRKQNPENTIEIRTTKTFHDRFIVLDDDRCWHVGASLKDAGNKVFMLSEFEDDDNRVRLLEGIQKAWDSSTQV